MDRNDSFSSSQASPGARNPTPTFTLTNPASDSGRYSPSVLPFSLQQEDLPRPPMRPIRKGKHIPEIQSLPEGETLKDMLTNIGPTTRRKMGPPSPLDLKTDTSDAELYENLQSPPKEFIQRPTTLSMPNSPMKSFEFFMDVGEFGISLMF